MNFESATANRIIFGNGVIKQAAPLTKEMGSKALVAVGASLARVSPLLDDLQKQHVEYSVFQVPGEPTTALIEDALAKNRDANIDVVIGFGGGSVLDAGKAIAALLSNPGDIFDYLEVIGKGQKLAVAPLPYIAIPTTAGTGTEVTKNAVLLSKAHRVKVSLRHNLMIPDIALIDPELTYSMPPAVTASTGLDALTQLIEPFVSNAANPLTDGICREGLHRVSRSLLQAFDNGNDKTAREDMAVASLFGGLALANAKLGAVHGFAGPLGGLFDAPHGAICARLLPFVMEANIKALHSRDGDSLALHRFTDVAKILTQKTNATTSDGVEWLQSLCAKLDVPPLSYYGMKRADIPAVVNKAQNASSMKGDPIKLDKEELTNILVAAL
jgi:alcohol dehydrogenase class IV